MRRQKERFTAIVMAGILLAMTGCSKNLAVPSQAESGTEASTQAVEESSESQESGEAAKTVGGFTLDAVEDSSLLNAKFLNYTHEKSGAKLVCIQNEDPELAFGVFYNTPYVDETDTNHVFEHAIIASSKKYPSKDIFFDMANKSYNTFINAFTYNTFTGYPLSSMSEDQLIKMADVYLSCMVDSDILENENIFKREAVRYELESKDAPLTMTGTVLTEDTGSLSDTESENLNNVIDALYPGEYAANFIGRAHRNYETLTYEHTLETFERCYHFDNSLILLYGDMDYKRMMKFIDDEYLSKAEKNGTDLSTYEDAPTKAGFVDVTVPSPAYEGDVTENASIINYAIDLSQEEKSVVTDWMILTDLLANNSSVFHQTLREAGIENEAIAGVDNYNRKEYLIFRLKNADESQKEVFKQAVEDTLKKLSETGERQDITDSVMKSLEISSGLTRDTANAGVNTFPNIVNYWTHTGSTDFYTELEAEIKKIEADKEQKLLKELAEKALKPERSVLVTTVPQAGLAEQIEQQREDYLVEKKAAMSDEELTKLVEDTKAFKEWNEESYSNQDFMISPEALPEQIESKNFEIIQKDGLTIYYAPADVEAVGGYWLYLDTGNVSNDDIFYLSLYQMLFAELNTGTHSKEEIQTLLPQYLYNADMAYIYPGEESGKNHHPMLRIKWYGMVEDFEEGLQLLMELFNSSDVSDVNEVKYILSRDIDSADLSRTSDPLGLARENAKESAGIEADTYRYRNAAEGQEFYQFLKKTKSKLEADPEYGKELADKINKTVERILVKGNVQFLVAAPEENKEEICSTVTKVIGGLPENQIGTSSFVLSEPAKKMGIAIESSDQYAVLYADLSSEEMMQGKYLPFLNAASDQFIVPKIRFQMGAYSAGAGHSVRSRTLGLYSYSDPNVGATVDIFNGIGDFLKNNKLSKEDLDGYILSAYADETLPLGVLQDPLQTMAYQMMGEDSTMSVAMINDIRNATIDDQQEAAGCIDQLVKSGAEVTVGNETKLNAEKDRFDQVISYRN